MPLVKVNILGPALMDAAALLIAAVSSVAPSAVAPHHCGYTAAREREVMETEPSPVKSWIGPASMPPLIVRFIPASIDNIALPSNLRMILLGTTTFELTLI